MKLTLEELSEQQLQFLVVLVDVFKFLLNFVETSCGVLLPLLARPVLIVHLRELPFEGMLSLLILFLLSECTQPAGAELVNHATVEGRL